MPIEDRDWSRPAYRERQAALQRPARRKLPNAAGVMIQHRKLDALNWPGRKLVYNGLMASWALGLVVAPVWLLVV